MSILIFGGGFLGKTLKKYNPTYRMVRSWEVLKEGGEFDPSYIVDYEPTVIINTIAQTNTRWCENCDHETEIKNIKLNGLFPSEVSKFCKSRKIKFVHFSTACIYAASQEPIKEDHCIFPPTKYTLQKYYGEYSLDPKDLIVRSRLFFGSIYNKSNLIYKLKTFKAFSKKQNSYTSTDTISRTVPDMISKNLTGTYNLVNNGTTSAYEMAEMMGMYGLSEYAPAVGAYSAPDLIISPEKLENALGYKIPDIKTEFLKCLQEHETDL